VISGTGLSKLSVQGLTLSTEFSIGCSGLGVASLTAKSAGSSTELVGCNLRLDGFSKLSICSSAGLLIFSSEGSMLGSIWLFSTGLGVFCSTVAILSSSKLFSVVGEFSTEVIVFLAGELGVSNSKFSFLVEGETSELGVVTFSTVDSFSVS